MAAKSPKQKAVKKAQPVEKLERAYTIPLRKQWLKVPKYRRAEKAVIAVRQFLSQHMKSADVRIGRELNKKLWKQGMQSPPHHVRVSVVKEDGTVFAELFGVKIQAAPKPAAKEAVSIKKAETEVAAELAGEEEKPVEARAES